MSTKDNILGLAALVYLVSATVAALWWASALTMRVERLEQGYACQQQKDDQKP